jgi:hypothetical protein
MSLIFVYTLLRPAAMFLGPAKMLVQRVIVSDTNRSGILLLNVDGGTWKKQ